MNWEKYRKLSITYFILFTTVGLGLLFSYVNQDGYFINIHSKDIHKTYHKYKIYNTWLNSILDIEPIDSLSLDINPETGDYIGANKDSKKSIKNFESWKNMCHFDKNLFNFFDYNDIQRKKTYF